MFGFIKKMFVGLLSACTIESFGKSLAFNLVLVSVSVLEIVTLIMIHLLEFVILIK